MERWGDDHYRQSDVPDGLFYTVSAGFRRYGQSAKPVSSEAFAQLHLQERYACGLRTDGHVSCWGDNDPGEASPL